MTQEITIELDDAREVMHDGLTEEFGEIIEADIEQTVKDRLTELYDNQDRLRQSQ